MNNERKENLQDIIDRVNQVDAGVNNLIIPILKDTIKDGNKHNNHLFIFAMCELVVILVTVITSIVLVYKQNEKYDDFLSQFDFETEQTVYQDLDSGEGDILNPTINNNR